MHVEENLAASVSKQQWPLKTTPADGESALNVQNSRNPMEQDFKDAEKIKLNQIRMPVLEATASLANESNPRGPEAQDLHEVKMRDLNNTMADFVATNGTNHDLNQDLANCNDYMLA